MISPVAYVMQDYENDAAFALAKHLMQSMTPADLDALLVREGFAVATPCRSCGRATMWQPGAEDLCICLECAR